MEPSFIKEIKWIKNFIKFLYDSRKIKGEKIYLIGAPVYGNLGDQAITLGEYKFLENIKFHKTLVEIPSFYIRRHTELFKFIIGKSDILIQGGGFLGSLWPVEEEMVRKVIKNFPDNKIVIFPQTLYFTDDEEGIKQKTISQEIYKEHKNITLFLRDEVSYRFAKNDMKMKNIHLAPDMALILDSVERVDEVRENILFCLRGDKEKSLSKEQEQKLIDVVGRLYPEDKIIYTDTVSTKNVWKNQREKAVYDKIEEFSKAKMVVTDRLHGMVFAALAGTPCIVMGSCNYKVKGIYNWIKNNTYISFVDDFNLIDESIHKVMMSGSIKNFDKTLIEGQFEELKEIILLERT